MSVLLWFGGYDFKELIPFYFSVLISEPQFPHLPSAPTRLQGCCDDPVRYRVNYKALCLSCI